MRFDLLGPMRVGDDRGPLEIRGVLGRTLLAVLLLDANAVVPVDRLTDVLWAGRPPGSAVASLHNHVMRLRRALGEHGGGRIRAVPPGYLIQVEPDELDLYRFDRLCAAGAEAVRSGRWAQASADLTAALALWRGEPVADVPGLGVQDPWVQHLAEARLNAAEGRIEADIELGRHRELIGELRTLTAEHPLRENFHAQLMLALYRGDRQAEALAAFQRLRRTLVGELGVEPSAFVQELHQRILRADPRLAAPAPDAATIQFSAPGSGTDASNAAALYSDTDSRADSGHGGPAAVTGSNVWPVPDKGPSTGGARFQLPGDTRAFTGRVRELEELTALAREAATGTEPGMAVICAIDGIGGIGKSTLAIHAAHRVRDLFPDGQLFLDLHGHTPGLDPLSAADALGSLLASLGVPPTLIPPDLQARQAFYRDRLDGARTLIILDDAAGAAQVRPLLPGTPGCLVLVTSRRRLAGLDDVFSVTLDSLSEADAADLLHKVAGPGRIPPQDPAVSELTALCGYLPLAVRIVAARLRHHRALGVEDLTSQLRDEHYRLEHLADQDRSLTAVFDSSYANLNPAEQRLLRLLGLVPGPDFDAHAVAALLDTDQSSTDRLLESLLDNNLLLQQVADRYLLHDLVRVYARAVGSQDPAEEREQAVVRLVEYYRDGAESADRLLARSTRPQPEPTSANVAHAAHSKATAPAPIAEAEPAPFGSDPAAALAWLRAERANLVASLSLAIAAGQSEAVLNLTGALADFLRQDGQWQQAATLHSAAIALARDRGDRSGEAAAAWDLGRVRQVTGHYAAAAELLEQALAIYVERSDLLGQANVLHALGMGKLNTDDYTAGIALIRRALAFYRQLGDRPGLAAALHGLGTGYLFTGNYPGAAALYEQALALSQETGDLHGQADVLQQLGRARHAQGDHAAAAALRERALEIYRELGDRLGQANTLQDLSRLWFITGNYPAAVDLSERALAVFQDLGHRHGQATSLRDLGRISYLTGDYPAAADLHRQALALYLELGSRQGQGYAFWDLGRVRHALGEHRPAKALLERALAMFRDLGHRHGEANALHDLGRVGHAMGERTAAAALLDQAQTLFRELGDRQGQAEALNSTGALLADTVGSRPALDEYRRALRLARRVRSPIDEARALDGAARCHAQLGDRTAAVADLDEALALYRRLGVPEASAAEALLKELADTETDSIGIEHAEADRNDVGRTE